MIAYETLARTKIGDNVSCKSKLFHGFKILLCDRIIRVINFKFKLPINFLLLTIERV